MSPQNSFPQSPRNTMEKRVGKKAGDGGQVTQDRGHQNKAF